MRYIGKSFENYLYQRWLRPQPHIHHKESRNFILAELTAGRGPLYLWSANADELKSRVPQRARMDDRDFIRAMEALWLKRWIHLLWNYKEEPLTPGFDDGAYWRLSV